MRRVLIICLALLSYTMHSKKLKEGIYRGVLLLNEERGTELPFNFTVTYQKGNPIITIRNSDERIVVDEIAVKGDSVNFKMPVFDTEFRTKITNKGLEGIWVNNYRTSANILKFTAIHGESRRFLFDETQGNPLFEGKWKVTFSPGSKDSSMAIGIFHHQEQTDLITGTFLTETGDYRYLEGMCHGNDLFLSAFDGSHAFLITGTNNSGRIEKGMFYSGAHFSQTWIASRDEKFSLSDPNEITFTKNKEGRVDFSFPDPTGKNISLSDEQFTGRPVIVQLMGTWCPNCMDETKYLAGLYNQYKDQGLRVIGLAYEKTTEFGKAAALVTRLKKRLSVGYEILITGKTGKEGAAASLSVLNHVTAFPTTIFLDRQHKVVRIHTGFSGPATGNEFGKFREETEELITKLLSE
jgi:thiol-disulfide isomerase/thioredoxin